MATLTSTLLIDIAQRLIERGCTVTVEYPGIIAVWAEDLIANPGHCWDFGTANGTWEGDLVNGDGEYQGQTLSTGVSRECDNADVIARAIYLALVPDAAEAQS